MTENRQQLLEKWVADLLVERPELFKEMKNVTEFYTNLYHGMPQIEIYPPKGATHLYLDHLFTSISSSIQWEIPGVKEYSWRTPPRKE